MLMRGDTSWRRSVGLGDPEGSDAGGGAGADAGGPDAGGAGSEASGGAGPGPDTGQDADKADTVEAGGTGNMGVDVSGSASDAQAQAQAQAQAAVNAAAQSAANTAAASAAQHAADDAALADFDNTVSTQNTIDDQALLSFDIAVANLSPVEKAQTFSLLNILSLALTGIIGGLPAVAMSLGKVAVGAMLSGRSVTGAVAQAAMGAMANNVVNAFAGGYSVSASDTAKANMVGDVVAQGLEAAVNGHDNAGVSDAIANGVRSYGFQPIVNYPVNLPAGNIPRTTVPSASTPGVITVPQTSNSANTVYDFGSTGTYPIGSDPYAGSTPIAGSSSNSGIWLAIGLALLSTLTG